MQDIGSFFVNLSKPQNKTKDLNVIPLNYTYLAKRLAITHAKTCIFY